MDSTRHEYDLEAVAGQFDIPGRFQSARPHGSGHINDTFVAVFVQQGRQTRYVHQRINHHVFTRPADVMDNIRRITTHLAGKLSGDLNARRVLELVPTRSGEWCHRDRAGNTWRTYIFIEGARTHDRILSREHAYQVARSFAEFQDLTADLTDPPLAETIPDFHNTPLRLRALEQAVSRDPCGRTAEAAAEIAFVESQARVASRLIDLEQSGAIRLRVAHNDTKVNNVMIDDDTGEGICVIDLDTVMPGLVHYDFGDLVRTAVSDAAEDEPDLASIRVRLPVFEALARGYLSRAADFLVPAEVEELAFSSRLLTLENAVRFLTDHLEGDTYFKTRHPGHNLERCRAQLQLYRELTAHEEAMQQIVLHSYRG